MQRARGNGKRLMGAASRRQQHNTASCQPPPPDVLEEKRGGWVGLRGGFGRTPCVTSRRVVVPLRGPGESPVLPFACCVGSLRSVGRCGRCSCWCRFRIRGAQ